MARVIFFVAWTVRIRPRRILSWPPAITSRAPRPLRFLVAPRAPRRWRFPRRLGTRSTRPVVRSFSSFCRQGLVALGCAERLCICCHRVSRARGRRGGVGDESFLELADDVTELRRHIRLGIVAHTGQQRALRAAHVLQQVGLKTTYVVNRQA